jgi:hypothetical protein
MGDIVELCRPRVGVRGVQAAWPEETDGCEAWDQLGRDNARGSFAYSSRHHSRWWPA